MQASCGESKVRRSFCENLRIPSRNRRFLSKRRYQPVRLTPSPCHRARKAWLFSNTTLSYQEESRMKTDCRSPVLTSSSRVLPLELHPMRMATTPSTSEVPTPSSYSPSSDMKRVKYPLETAPRLMSP